MCHTVDRIVMKNIVEVDILATKYSGDFFTDVLGNFTRNTPEENNNTWSSADETL